MSALSIQVPFPVFQDRDGQPLENGYVWIGVANLNPQTNPLVAYYDAALTIVAAQPLRTLNGYISRAGTPAQIYVDASNYSILVQDSKGSMVYNFPDGSGISPDACGVTYDPPFTGAIAYPVCEKLSQYLSVKDFGASPSKTAAENTAAINAAITYAAANGFGVDLVSGSYPIQNIRIKNGLRFLQNGTLIPSGLFGEGALEFDGGSLGGTAVSRCTITGITIDCVNGPKRGIFGEGVAFSTIENNQLINISSVAGTIAGIILNEGSFGNKITFNNVLGTPYDTSGVMIGMFSTGVDPYFGYFTNATGFITQPSNPCYDNQIIGNKTTGGQQGIALQGTQQNIVDGNTIRSPKDRAIILIASSQCTIVANECLDFYSTGIHMAYGSSNNAVSGNHISSVVAFGEAGIQCHVGSNNNCVTGNRITTTAVWGLYVACSCLNNSFSSNNINAFTYAGIAIESDWTTPRPAFAIYSRASFGPPPTGSRWAFSNSTGNTFADNVIGNKDPASATATGIYIAQINSYDGVSEYALTGNTFSGNRITGTTNTSNFYTYESTAGKISGNVFTNNTVATGGQGSVIVQPSGASAFRSYFNECYGNSIIDDINFFGFAVNDATPSVERGIYFSTANTTATTITEFTRGNQGQEIVVRGDVNTTIAYNASLIRTRGDTNITGLNANKFVSFKYIQGIWYEQWRNF